MINTRFDDLRPYYDEEVNQAMQRMADDPLLGYVANFLYKDLGMQVLQDKLRNVHSVSEFQDLFMFDAIQKVIDTTTSSFTWTGLECIDRDKKYLFVSNHRDILLDSALLEYILYVNNIETTEITFGSNLMRPQFVVDIGKSNKMFKVERGGSPREFYEHSKHLSEYIRHTLLQKKESVWIAQRNGRTKDGHDQTDPGLLKMFSMSGVSDLVDNLGELNIVPLAISYQVEPCVAMKAKEIYISRRQKYQKKEGEDLESILSGILGFKGHVHIHITPPLTVERLSGLRHLPKKDIFDEILKVIDSQILNNYLLFDTNYMAFDRLYDTDRFLNQHYSKERRQEFDAMIEEAVNSLEGDKTEIEKIVLGIYANPVLNKK